MITYRHATPDDAKALIAYSNAVGGESDNLTFGRGEFNTSPEAERAFLTSLAAAPTGCGILCLDDDTIVAFGTVTASDRPRICHRGNLGISVRKAYWGKGIGTALMQQLIHFAQTAGLTHLMLEVRVDNAAAIHLYRKLGFDTLCRWPDFFKLDDTFADALLMQRQL